MVHVMYELQMYSENVLASEIQHFKSTPLVLLFMSGCLACMLYLSAVHRLCPQRPEEGTRAKGTGVTDPLLGDM